MRKVELGNTGESVSCLCMGTMLFGSRMEEKASFAALDAFAEAGGDFLDTANCYAWWEGRGQFVGDESEAVLGRWMKARGNRRSMFVATKLGARLPDPQGVRNDQGDVIWERVPAAYERLTPAAVRRAAEGSLRRLQTDTIDLLYAHIEDRATPLEDTLEALHALVEEGKVRHVGLSNYPAWRLALANATCDARGWAPCVAIQNEYSYLRRRPGLPRGVDVGVDEGLLDYLRGDCRTTLLAYSPMLKGIYEDAHKRSEVYLWAFFDCADSRARLAALEEVARDLGVTSSQLVLAWLLGHDPRVIPVIGGSRPEHYDQALQAATIQLPHDVMARLNHASG